MVAARARVGALAALASIAGCQLVLEADERRLDPSLLDAGSTTEPTSAACASYCSAIAAACASDNSQYASVEVCLAVCAHFPPGESGATVGNALACRQREAELASTTGEPVDHCAAAGPDGRGVCGTSCDGYCTLEVSVCPTEFDGVADCLNACRSMPSLSTYDTSDTRGDTVQCRIFHASAATQNASMHCPHAGRVPTHYCVAATDAGQAADQGDASMHE